MKSPKSFEAGAARLEEILEKMADRETPLAEAVRLYAEAADLMAYCTETLEKAQLQIREIDAKWAASQPPQEDNHDTAELS